MLCINVIVTSRSRNSCCVTEPGALAGWLAGRGRGRGRGRWIRTLLFLVSPNLSRLLVPLFLGALPPRLLPDGQKITQGHKRPAVMTPSHTHFCVFNAVCAQMKKNERKNTACLFYPGPLSSLLCVRKKTHKLSIAQKTKMNYSPYKFVSTGFFFITPPARLTSHHGTNRHCASRSAP